MPISQHTNSQNHGIGNPSGSTELSRDGSCDIDLPANMRTLGWLKQSSKGRSSLSCKSVMVRPIGIQQADIQYVPHSLRNTSSSKTQCALGNGWFSPDTTILLLNVYQDCQLAPTIKTYEFIEHLQIENSVITTASKGLNCQTAQRHRRAEPRVLQNHIHHITMPRSPRLRLRSGR